MIKLLTFSTNSGGMPLPGFTTEVFSSFSQLSENYYYSIKSDDGYVGQNLTSRMMSISRSSNRWKVSPEPQKEPSESGRRAWIALENSCNNLQCEECRNDCRRVINGLHDAINIKLGKSMRTPSDFIYLRDFVNEMSKHALLGYK
jgi:hypothetical protein